MNICLCKMTKELCRAYFRDFVNDPNVYEDLSQFRAYEYSDSHVDEYWQKQQSLDRSYLAIMLDEKPIGEIIFKSIDRNARTCTLSIHLQNDNVKNQGYGTRAEILALDFAFRELNLISVYADAIHKNRRSQHVLEKAGFCYTHEDETFKYYRCEANKAERWQKVKDLIGKIVHVVVDRPIGYQHGDIIYPINYGYVPGLIAGDGEEQDAYILGVSEPIAEFDGQVVAAICRRNDCEDKLVVVPAGSVYHQGQIAEAVHFQEQYFDIRIISCFEKSCGVLPYRRVNGRQEFLLVFETYSKCWSLPKGHIEAGETDVQTALRELYEETGLTANLDTSRCASIEYPISSFARKQVAFFLGEVAGEPKVREGEIDKFKWVTAEELKDYLFPDTYEACKALLR